MGDLLIQMKKEKRIDPASSSRGSNRCTKQSENSWRKFKHSIKLDMTSTGLIIISRLEIGYGFTSARRD
jgi:hypothetical protein